MSHFSVFVFTREKPDDAALAKILAPWHEFECTGRDDEYVKDVDNTDEFRETYASSTRKMMRGGPGGKLEDYDLFKFYRDPTREEQEKIGPHGGSGTIGETFFASQDWEDGLGYRAKVHFFPEGWMEETVPVRDVMTEAEFAEYYYGAKAVQIGTPPDLGDEHKYGYALVDGGRVVQLVRRTNPDKKWDWYQIGGRWTGALVPHYDPAEDPDNREKCWLCDGVGKRPDVRERVPCNGCGGSGVRTKWPTKWKSVGDQAALVDVPVIALRVIAERRALARYDAVMKIVSDVTGVAEGSAWEQIPVLTGEEWYTAAREAYNSNPIIVALRAAKDVKGQSLIDPFDGPGELRATRADYARAARAAAFCPFACVLTAPAGAPPGWYQRGEMGWWAIVRDEKDDTAWSDEFAKLVDAMDPGTWVTVVDCHI
jgi:hypothetical protein